VEDARVTVIVRLATFVDIDDDADSEASGLSFSARHDAVLADGRRVVLLDDRGWTQSILTFGDHALSTREGRRSPWEFVTRERLEENARDVVGPDEPYGNSTRAETEEGHWATLAARLGNVGVDADWTELPALPHDVEFSVRLLARLGDLEG
jgi:hypothetical protein